MKTKLMLALLTVAVLTFPAFAHDPSGMKGGFISGFIHPITGWDHVAAMVAVGIWGAFLGNRAVWILPIVFPFVMAIGGIMGIAGVPMPFITLGIAMSSIGIGMAITFQWRAQLWLAAIIVGFFAIFHGHIHGQNLPGASDPIFYALGFVLGSGLLHLAGILFGLIDNLWKHGRTVLRVAGVVIALVGVAFLLGYI